MVRTNLQRTAQSRVFTIEDRAAPGHTPEYQTLTRATALTWSQGDVTPIRIPDPRQYGKFLTVDKIHGQPGLPGLSLEFRTTRDLSDVLALVRKGCPLDIQIHVGACKDPSDFDAGWEKILVLEGAEITNYSTGELGAFDADQEAPVMETIDIVGEDYYELKPLVFAEQAASQIVQTVLDVVICDSKACGACGIVSDGCQKVFAIQSATAGSPGLPSEVVFTDDGGATWDETNITSLAANKSPDAIACVGPYLAAVSNGDCSIHYALLADILTGTETWTEIVTGLVCATGAPNDLFSVSRTQTWIVGDGGYIYFSADITAGATAQTSGDVTAQNLNCIHGFDEENLLVGGAAGALLLTRNGGATWSLVTVRAAQAAVAINAVWMLGENVWLVGYADGDLDYTIDGGVTWTQKTVPGSLTSITDIAFATPSVGYIAGGAAGPAGKLLRTINGGNTWYVLPETSGQTVPTSDSFVAIAACGEDPNLLWAGGLGANGVDGILVKGA